MNLFKETTIGNLEVSNHFIRSATYEGKATEDGYPTQQTINIYQKLAEGNVGTIITSYSYITDYEQPQKYQLVIYSDDMIPAYKNLTDQIHQYNSKIIMQIVHGSSWGQGYPETAKILGPSTMEHPDSHLVSKEMTKDEIQEVVQLFAKAALRVKKAGFDGVQIHCAHNYLLAHFISPLFNHRIDEYGGSVENRFRIVKEVYLAIREAVGKDYPVWIKMNSSDELPGGLTVEDFLYMASELAKLGISAIEVSGDRWKTHSLKERAYYKDAAIKLSKIIDTPIILTGGLRKMSDLKDVMLHSRINLFGFARPFMRDPYFIESLKKELDV